MDCIYLADSTNGVRKWLLYDANLAQMLIWGVGASEYRLRGSSDTYARNGVEDILDDIARHTVSPTEQ
eukprot:6583954-Heterocapsa_arctica.AAC.1